MSGAWGDSCLNSIGGTQRSPTLPPSTSPNSLSLSHQFHGYPRYSPVDWATDECVRVPHLKGGECQGSFPLRSYLLSQGHIFWAKLYQPVSPHNQAYFIINPKDWSWAQPHLDLLPTRAIVGQVSMWIWPCPSWAPRDVYTCTWCSGCSSAWSLRITSVPG